MFYRCECKPGFGGNGTRCAACAATEFRTGATDVATCAPKKTACPPGQYFAASADSTADATCTTCDPEHYKAGTTGDISCTPWGTCPKGKGLKLAGSDSADITCEACREADYKFSKNNDRSACADHAKCPAGQGSNWNTLTAAQKTTQPSACTPCSATEFSSTNGYGPCNLRKKQCGADRRHRPRR